MVKAGRPKNFDAIATEKPKKKVRVVPLDSRAIKRKCSESRARHNDAASNAVITRVEYPRVHYPRMGKAAIVKHADNAVDTARRKDWATKSPQKPPRIALNVGVRYFEHDGTVAVGIPIEKRSGRKGTRDFVVFKREFTHRKRDRRVARFVAVPKEFVIDVLPKPATTPPF